MSRYFHRAVAFLLVPCLLADPAFAYPASHPINCKNFSFVATEALAEHPISVALKSITPHWWRIAGALTMAARLVMAQNSPVNGPMSPEDLKPPLSAEQLEIVQNELIKEDRDYEEEIKTSHPATEGFPIWSNTKPSKRKEILKTTVANLVEMILWTTHSEKELKKLIDGNHLKWDLLPWDLIREKRTQTKDSEEERSSTQKRE